MNRYISDRDLEALANAGELDDLDGINPVEEDAPVIDPKWIMAAAIGGLALVGILWYSYSQLGGTGNVPLITANGDPIKVRPTNPGGLEIPFQNMALYDRIQPSGTQALPTLTPPAEVPQIMQQAAPLEPAVVASPLPDASSSGAQPSVTVETLPPVENLPPATVARGEGESLFAVTVNSNNGGQVSDANETDRNPPVLQFAPPPQPPIEPVPTDFGQVEEFASNAMVALNGWPPIPQRHPSRDVAQFPAAQQGSNFIQAPSFGSGEQRRIQRGTIASAELPLAAAQEGLRPGGALGLTDDDGTLIYRNSLRQNADPVLPSGPVEGDVEIVLQRPNSGGAFQTQSPLTVTPVQPNRSADGTIEIRSPNRVPITINSDPQVTGSATQTAAPTNATNMAEAAAQTRLIPLPPDRAAGPASGVPSANPIPQQREPLRQSLNEVNNLPINARAPEPVSTGIVRGTVVNQRAAAPGNAPQSQDLFQPVPQAIPQFIPQPATQQTTVSNIPPTINAPVPAVPPAASSTSNDTSEGWRIQLASVGSQEAAIQEWRRFQRANEDLLGSLDLKVQRADLGARGIYYRVQAGILSRDAASDICVQLKSRGTDCLIKRD